jgi:hypothetical protein
MNTGPIRRRAVPVLFAWRDHDRVTRANLVKRVAPSLNADTTLEDHQPLGARMDVPVRPGSCFESDPIDHDGRAIVGFSESLGLCTADEGLGVCDMGGDIAPSKNLHVPAITSARSEADVERSRLTASYRHVCREGLVAVPPHFNVMRALGDLHDEAFLPSWALPRFAVNQD